MRAALLELTGTIAPRTRPSSDESHHRPCGPQRHPAARGLHDARRSRIGSARLAAARVEPRAGQRAAGRVVREPRGDRLRRAPPPASIVDPAVAEIARVAGVPVDQVTVVSAEAVTFPDGSLGCPQPGMAYTQIPVDGYRIVAKAAGTTYDYRGTGGTFQRCVGAQPSPS